MNRLYPVIAVLLAVVASGPATAAAVVYEASGANAASIQATVDSFRAALGSLNANTPGSVGSGRREINWDGVGASFRDPHPANFFNSNSPRGVVFSTPDAGARFVVSGDSGSPEFLFENLTPYSSTDNFSLFSSQRLFGIAGGDTMDVHFFVPGSATAATTHGFGAVFTDTDTPGSSSLAFFDIDDNLLFTRNVLTGVNAGLSFLGVEFTSGERVARVRIQSGSGSFTDNGCGDCVLMDDFIFGEPTVVPLPAPAWLLGAGLLALRLRRKI